MIQQVAHKTFHTSYKMHSYFLKVSPSLWPSSISTSVSWNFIFNLEPVEQVQLQKLSSLKCMGFFFFFKIGTSLQPCNSNLHCADHTVSSSYVPAYHLWLQKVVWFRRLLANILWGSDFCNFDLVHDNHLSQGHLCGNHTLAYHTEMTKMGIHLPNWQMK